MSAYDYALSLSVFEGGEMWIQAATSYEDSLNFYLPDDAFILFMRDAQPKEGYFWRIPKRNKMFDKVKLELVYVTIVDSTNWKAYGWNPNAKRWTQKPNLRKRYAQLHNIDWDVRYKGKELTDKERKRKKEKIKDKKKTKVKGKKDKKK